MQIHIEQILFTKYDLANFLNMGSEVVAYGLHEATRNHLGFIGAQKSFEALRQ